MLLTTPQIYGQIQICLTDILETVQSIVFSPPFLLYPKSYSLMIHAKGWQLLKYTLDILLYGISS